MQVNTLVGTATGKAVEEGEARGRVSRERQQLLQGDLLDKVFLHFTLYLYFERFSCPLIKLDVIVHR